MTQARLFPAPAPSVATGRFGTFGDNRRSAIHRWFPFIEGYSHEMVALALADARHTNPSVHDPFGGTGTTCLSASALGMSASFCEVNPFMAWVAQTKANGHMECRGQGRTLRHLADLVRGPLLVPPIEAHPLTDTDDRRSYFPHGVARQLLAHSLLIDRESRGVMRDIARLALARTVVPCSNMTRRADLCRRNRRDRPPENPVSILVKSLHMMADDLDDPDAPSLLPIRHLCGDARRLDSATAVAPFDLVVTSPPYLNGTNYFRNTKLELLALGFIQSEDDLAPLRASAIAAGINNISGRREAPILIPTVEAVATQLDERAYDRRIPMMVRLYFSDMRMALSAVRRCSSPSAALVLDMGDSRFAGVTVPTDELLVEVAASVGWQLVKSDHLRKRCSYDGTPLKQVLLRFRAT